MVVRIARRPAVDSGSSAESNGTKESNGTLWTVSEAAEALGAHPNSVRRWADMGMLPSYRIGMRGDRRFKPQDVSVFLVAWKGT